MSKIRPIKRSFNAGILSPVMYGQIDFNKWASAVKYMKNFIPLPQGPARRRGGTQYSGSVKNSSDRVWLASFQFSTTEAFILEFGPGYIRFWFNHAQLLDDENNILEVSTPWGAGDLTRNGKFGLSLQQSADVIYITCTNGNYPVYKLTRNTNTNWSLAEASFSGGPFADINSDKSSVVYTDQFRIWSEDGNDLPDGTPTTTSLCNITANTDIFQASHVGCLFYIEASTDAVDDDTGHSGYIPAWAAGTSETFSAGVFCRSDGKYYEDMDGTKTGNTQPTWTAGAHRDGSGGDASLWRYSGGGWGIIEITAVNSATSATGKIVTELPPSVRNTVGKTYKYAFGDWSDVLRYPQFAAFFRGRLVFAGRQKIWSSVAGDLQNFSPMTNGYEAESDDSINDRIDDTQDTMQWIVASAGKIFIGTAGYEFAYGEQSLTSVFGAGNTKVELNSTIGSNEVQAERLFDRVAFVQRAGRKVMIAAYDSGSDSFTATNACILAPHLFTSEIIALAYQQEPNRILWVLLEEGRLLGLTYDAEENITGWHDHDIGGTVESIKVIPDIDGGRDELWMVVKRTINGATVRYLEYMLPEFDSAFDTQEWARVLDCMLTYDGDAVTEVSGLSHLEGETVAVVTDGATHASQTVSDGKISLDWESSVVHVGLNNAAEIITLPLEGGIKRFAKARLRFLDTLGGKFGDDGGKYLDKLRARDYSDNMDEAPPLFNGVVTVPWPGEFNENGSIRIVQDLPQPMTIVSIDPVGEVEDD
ncbi:hypothetical protein ACXDK0_002149 [Klebsiella pneumoniae]